MAISLSHRLGLHQSQRRFSLGALTSETRKKVFWSLYTLDWSVFKVTMHISYTDQYSFSAALLGLPKLLNEGDIHAEYPADVDDENVSESGFQSTLPGEFTRLSSALALFRLSRVMSKVLDENYPAASSHDLSLQKCAALNDDLDAWLGSLPNHLRLHFVQDKPSTNVVGSRSPLLVSCSALLSKMLLITFGSHWAITMSVHLSIALRLALLSAPKLHLQLSLLHNRANTSSRSFNYLKNAG